MGGRTAKASGRRYIGQPLRVFEVNRRVEEAMQAREVFEPELAKHLKKPEALVRSWTEYDVLHGYMKMSDVEFSAIAKALMIREEEFFAHRLRWVHLLRRLRRIRPLGQPLPDWVSALGLEPRP